MLRAQLRAVPIALVLAATCPFAASQTTYRASVDSSGAQVLGVSGNGNPAAFSADGRYLAFQGAASDLVPGDQNGQADVFVRDLETGSVEIVSLSSTGAQADGSSLSFSMSADARFVAFWSMATNLVPGDTNGFTDVFVRDRTSGTTVRASVSSLGQQANSGCLYAAISADGQHVAFTTNSSNLVPGDLNGLPDVFVHDMATGVTERVDVSSSGSEAHGNIFYAPSLSGDGRFVAFSSSASDLVPGDTNNRVDVFVRDRQRHLTSRASVSDSEIQGNGDSYIGAGPSMSLDGRLVVFSSRATNLVPGNMNADWDVYLRNLWGGTTELISVDSSKVPGNGGSGDAALAGNGRYVAFSSIATNLADNDSTPTSDVFLRDRLTGITECISVDTDGMSGNSRSAYVAISSDGRLVAFESVADNLVPGDTNAESDVFIRDRTPIFTSFCAGDGSAKPCPCGNAGASGQGCENSASTGGAQLAASGGPSLSADGLQLTCAGELASSISLFLQGDAETAPTVFGDGLQCVGGRLSRLRVESAIGGTATYPDGAETHVHVRSADLGDPIQAGFTRRYQVVYRDGAAAFCQAPAGGTFNASNGISVVWGP